MNASPGPKLSSSEPTTIARTFIVASACSNPTASSRSSNGTTTVSTPLEVPYTEYRYAGPPPSTTAASASSAFSRGDVWIDTKAFAVYAFVDKPADPGIVTTNGSSWHRWRGPKSLTGPSAVEHPVHGATHVLWIRGDGLAGWAGKSDVLHKLVLGTPTEIVRSMLEEDARREKRNREHQRWVDAKAAKSKRGLEPAAEPEIPQVAPMPTPSVSQPKEPARKETLHLLWPQTKSAEDLDTHPVSITPKKRKGRHMNDGAMSTPASLPPRKRARLAVSRSASPLTLSKGNGNGKEREKLKGAGPSSITAKPTSKRQSKTTGDFSESAPRVSVIPPSDSPAAPPTRRLFIPSSSDSDADRPTGRMFRLKAGVLGPAEAQRKEQGEEEGQDVEACEAMKPVLQELLSFKGAPNTSRKERARALRVALRAVGQHVDRLAIKANVTGWQDRLWSYAARFWFVPVKGPVVRDLYLELKKNKKKTKKKKAVPNLKAAPKIFVPSANPIEPSSSEFELEFKPNPKLKSTQSSTPTVARSEKSRRKADGPALNLVGLFSDEDVHDQRRNAFLDPDSSPVRIPNRNKRRVRDNAPESSDEDGDELVLRLKSKSEPTSSKPRTLRLLRLDSTDAESDVPATEWNLRSHAARSKSGARTQQASTFKPRTVSMDMQPDDEELNVNADWKAAKTGSTVRDGTVALTVTSEAVKPRKKTRKETKAVAFASSESEWVVDADLDDEEPLERQCSPVILDTDSAQPQLAVSATNTGTHSRPMTARKKMRQEPKSAALVVDPDSELVMTHGNAPTGSDDGNPAVLIDFHCVGASELIAVADVIGGATGTEAELVNVVSTRELEKSQTVAYPTMVPAIVGPSPITPGHFQIQSIAFEFPDKQLVLVVAGHRRNAKLSHNHKSIWPGVLVNLLIVCKQHLDDPEVDWDAAVHALEVYYREISTLELQDESEVEGGQGSDGRLIDPELCRMMHVGDNDKTEEEDVLLPAHIDWFFPTKSCVACLERWEDDRTMCVCVCVQLTQLISRSQVFTSSLPRADALAYYAPLCAHLESVHPLDVRVVLDLTVGLSARDDVWRVLDGC
ncbi:unnamed protein product [Mycena citricolor]|uniref:Chromodomain-helicase-DNA-binding protein 1-like C-terminal domain-containing protein n=1 Tax=Mycena citricolor TaxID=2018698 RepID=A0AAD2HJ35_9AGAR|nr:unnamed protein product [Mycena citricolor]